MESVDAAATADTSVESLQAKDLLSLLDLAAPVSRGAILQRAAELAATHQGDPATEKVIRRAGERLAVMAAQNATGMLILDEEGGRDVPLMEPGSAVQDFATLQAQPTYPQAIVEGMLNPISRRVLSTCISVECVPTAAVPPPTALQLAEGYGVDISFRATSPTTKPGFTASGAYTVESSTPEARASALAPVPSTMVNLLEAGQSNSGPYLGGPPPSGMNPDGTPIGMWPHVNGNPIGGMLPTAALIKQTKIQEAAAALGCDPAGPALPPGGIRPDPSCPPATLPAISLADYTQTFPARFNKVLSVRLKQLSFPNSIYNYEPRGTSCPPAAPIPALYVWVEGDPDPGDTSRPVPTPTGDPSGEPEPCEPAVHGTPGVVELVCEGPEDILQNLPVSVYIPAGSYTFASLAEALYELTSVLLVPGIRMYVTPGGYVWFGVLGDPDGAHKCIIFPPLCASVGSKCTDGTGNVVVCNPGGAVPPGMRLVGTSGLGPLLGFQHYSFASGNSNGPHLLPLTAAEIEALPSVGSQALPPAKFIGATGLLRPAVLAPYQAVLSPMDSTKVYVAVDDFTHNSYPTFVGQTGDSILPGDIIGEAYIPNGQFGATTIIGDHLTVGLPYSLRTYFGQVTLERLRVQILGKDGKPVDTHGSSFSLVLELEQLYNV
jgi:hypothetical protein